MEHREFNKRKVVYDKLHKYDYLAKDNDFIEITEWTNGEGYDIQISDTKRISLTEGELNAIQYLINCLIYDFNK